MKGLKKSVQSVINDNCNLVLNEDNTFNKLSENSNINHKLCSSLSNCLSVL